MDLIFFKRSVTICLLGAGHLLAQAAPEAEDIRDAKPLIEIPNPVESDGLIWWIIAGAALLLVVGWFFWRRLKGKRKLPTASETALTDLSELGKSSGNLPAEEFAERAALSIRRYIAGAFGIAAPNRTTEEFFRALPSTSIRDDDGHLHSFLKSCDLAKFAAAELNNERRATLIESARNFVIATSTPEGGGNKP